ncbi:MAG TPA: hypothetical protein VNL17_15405 [Verrucomicrobiae bacterium]|nr:hypothetical protein [Verrucomicrobiae bacterium]
MRYLTIRDYDSELEAYRDCLHELHELHSRFKEAIELSQKNRKHALYLLAGTAISAGDAAFDQYCKEFVVGVHQLARFILEIHSLVEYFLVIDDEAGGEIERWFTGEFIKTRYNKFTKSKIEEVIERKADIPFKGLPMDELLERERVIQKNFAKLSDFSHPTIHSTKQPKACDFGQLILMPIIHILVDTQRMYFFPEDSVTGLMFSEFRLLFWNFKKGN